MPLSFTRIKWKCQFFEESYTPCTYTNCKNRNDPYVIDYTWAMEKAEAEEAIGAMSKASRIIEEKYNQKIYFF